VSTAHSNEHNNVLSQSFFTQLYTYATNKIYPLITWRNRTPTPRSAHPQKTPPPASRGAISDLGSPQLPHTRSLSHTRGSAPYAASPAAYSRPRRPPSKTAEQEPLLTATAATDYTLHDGQNQHYQRTIGPVINKLQKTDGKVRFFPHGIKQIRYPAPYILV
jgi:hypothetical protein